jgi:hypothetical protein
MSEINHKLLDSLYLKEKDFNDLVLYNKEKYNEQKDSSSESIGSRSHSSSNSHSHSCSQSHISKASPNKTSYINSNTIINNDINNNNRDKFNNTKKILSNQKSYEFLNTNNNIPINQKNNNKFASCNAIYNKIAYDLIINKNQNSNAETTKSESVKGYASKNDFQKQNNEKNNLEKDIGLNEGVKSNLTLPKIKLINDSYSIIHDKKTLFSPELKNKNINLLRLKNINTSAIKQSIQNIFKKSNPKENKPDSIFSNIKLIKKESPFKSDPDSLNEVKIFQSKSKKGLSNLRLKLLNSTHENEHQKMNEDNKYRSITISNENTIKSIDINSANNLLYSLKKINPNYKFKIYDTYKTKENEEENLENKEAFNPFVTRLIKKKYYKLKKSKILQKEK